MKRLLIIVAVVMGATLTTNAQTTKEKKKVAVVPGSAFGDCGEGFVRISYAYSIDNLKNAISRIEEYITELRNKK